MYLHLTAHSAFSLGEGLASPAELAAAAAKHNMPALGLTDHRLLAGSVEFVRACNDQGVQPILGLEVDLDDGKLALLATSLEGWANLCRLSSALALQDDPAAPCSFADLLSCSKDLIALCSGLPESRAPELKSIFPQRLYIVLDSPASAARLASLAQRCSLPVVATHPIYYLDPEGAALQRTLSAIRLNTTLDRLPANAAAPAEAYFMSAEQMQARFRDYPEALAATEEIAARCKFDLPLDVPRMPTVPLPLGQTAAGHLRQKAEAGARLRYGEITPEIRARLDHELDVIARMGFEPVFLIVEEVLDFARRTGVPYSSRGSAASSLVAHCLGITSPDPLRLNLYFERFLNPARRTPPDIDTDLCSRRRDSVIRHVFEVYGEDRVAMVGTINRYRPRSALGDVAKAHGLPPAEVRALVDQLPHAWWARFEENDEGGQPSSPFEALRLANPSAPHRRMFDDAEKLLNPSTGSGRGLPRHLSVHAGGLIVAPGPLTDIVPVMRSGSKGVIITQLDLDSAEALGLVKIDLLGIRGLTVVGDVADSIRAAQPGRYENLLAVLDATPSEDEATARRVEAGGTIGCFQIESPGMRSTLREIRARSEDDIMAALALYRPGPLTGGLKNAFVRRFKSQEKVEHIHPALEPLLEETFGVILYQEQVLRIAHELAGFSLAEADLLRRAMSHFDPGKRMQELRQKFIGEAGAKKGIPAATAERVWDMMAAFAGYGFPKAHAASYAQIGWRSAWCKTHFPAEFMAAVLANWGGYYSQRVYLSEARRMGLTVRPPHVNFSKGNFVVKEIAAGDRENLPHTTARAAVLGGEDAASSEVSFGDLGAENPKTLFMGLDQVRDLTRRTIERITHLAPFHSLEDFLTRVDPRPAEALNLASVGALDGFGAIPSMLRRLEGGDWQRGQMSLFEWNAPASEADWTLERRVAAQEDLLGIGVDAHPLELVADRIAAAGALSISEALEGTGRRVTVAGVRQSSHPSRTRRGVMLYLSLEDLGGMLEVTVPPELYRRARSALGSTAALLLTGMIELDEARGEPVLRAEKAERVW